MTLSLLVLSLAAADTSSGAVLNFTATWCGPCQQMSPIVSRLERQGHPIRKVDVDRHPELAKKFGVTAMPTFLLVVDEKEVHRIVGATTEAELKRLMAVIPRHRTGGGEPDRPATGEKPRVPIPLSEAGEEPEARDRGERGVPAAPPDAEEWKGPAAVEDAAALRAEAGSAGDGETVIRAKYDRDDVTPTAAAAGNPMAASARIRIKDDSGINFGSATIIDSRPGRTILLTCGHIFRDLPREAVIEVDVFASDGRFEKYVGQAIAYDLEADVGLLAIPTETPLPSIEVAPPDRRVTKGEQVYSIGCGGGEPPSQMDLHVTALNRYLGPDNIECTGVPQQGRSGGGLFGESGRLIGVCIAADPRDQRGLYCALPPIYALLDRARLSHLYQGGDSEPARLAAAEASPGAKAALAPTTDRQAEREGRAGDSSARRDDRLAGAEFADQPAFSGGDGHRLPPASASPSLGRAGEAEVVCIIRPLDDPRAASRVVIINRASSRFLSYLQGEMDDQPQPTVYRIQSHETLFAGRPWRPGPQDWTAARPATEPDQAPAPAGPQTHTLPSASPEAADHFLPQRYRRSAESRRPGL